MFRSFFFIFLFYVCSSCTNRNKPKALDKTDKLDSLLISPIDRKLNSKILEFGNIEFTRSYILIDNIHQYFYKDTLIRYTSQKGDVIELLKNKYTDNVSFLRFISNNLEIKYGIYVGMSYEDFSMILPTYNNNKNVVIFEDEFSELKFYFKDKKLVKILCLYYLD